MPSEGTLLRGWWFEYSLFVDISRLPLCLRSMLGREGEGAVSYHDCTYSCCYNSAGNIGLSREFDHRWITQYNSLFCVTNENGQVMTWKLTKSVAFSDIEETLLKLKARISEQGKVIHEFYVDICCSWRQKLQEVFGEH